MNANNKCTRDKLLDADVLVVDYIHLGAGGFRRLRAIPPRGECPGQHRASGFSVVPLQHAGRTQPLLQLHADQPSGTRKHIERL